MNTSVIINYITSALVLIVGSLMVAGVILANAEKSTRIVFGCVLVIYGIYRVINTVSKQKLAKLQEKQEWMKREKEKLMNR